MVRGCCTKALLLLLPLQLTAPLPLLLPGINFNLVLLLLTGMHDHCRAAVLTAATATARC